MAAVVVMVAIGGCVTFDPPLAVGKEPQTIEYSNADSTPSVALVLSGGAARGFAHVGVLKVLEQEGLQPDLIVGTSAGAIVGALYASGLCGPGLEQAVGEMDSSLYSDVVIPGLGGIPGSLGFVQGDNLRRFITQHVRWARIEDFPIRFAAVATDLHSGELKAFNAGDVGMATRASSAVPGVITPASIGGRQYDDGQIVSPIPVESARKLGAKIVIAVDVLYPPQEARLTGAMSVVFQAFSIASRASADRELVSADLVITPRIPPTSGQYSFEERAMLIESGEQAARDALPLIRAAMGRKAVRPGLAASGVKTARP